MKLPNSEARPLSERILNCVELSTACVCSGTQSCPALPRPHGLPGSSGHEIFRQEYWNGLLFPPPGDLPNLGIELKYPASPALQVDSLPVSHQGSPKSCACVLSRVQLFVTPGTVVGLYLSHSAHTSKLSC